MDTVIVSAPGKVIIHGEHAVVFGKKALAGSLGLRTKVTLQLTNNNAVIVNLPDIDIKLHWECQMLNNAFTLPLCGITPPTEVEASMLARLKEFADVDDSVTDTKKLAAIAFLYLFCSIAPVNGVVPSVHVNVTSTLPTSAGLGSSAAFSTCLATSLLVSSKKITAKTTLEGALQLTDVDRELINRWAFMAEKIIHGRPSGIDNSVSTYGGALSFQAGKIEPLEQMPQFCILLINTRVPRSTRQLVENVRRKHDRFPDIIQPVLSSIEAITRHCQLTLAALSTSSEKDESLFKTLEELIDINQHHLEVLGVGHPSLNTVYSIAARHRLHAKLTGAGGGGCAFALVPPYISTDAVNAAITEMVDAGFDCFTTSLGGPGVDVTVTSQDTLLPIGNNSCESFESEVTMT